MCTISHQIKYLTTSFFLAEAVPMGPWVNGQPDGGPAQNCVVYGNYGDGGWLDYFCTGRLTSICESTHYNLWFVFQNQSTCFCLVSFFGRMFLYYQGQIHTSNLNFSAKNNFGAKMRNYFSLDEKKIVKIYFWANFEHCQKWAIHIIWKNINLCCSANIRFG